jgi:hypothetical protein
MPFWLFRFDFFPLLAQTSVTLNKPLHSNNLNRAYAAAQFNAMLGFAFFVP